MRFLLLAAIGSCAAAAASSPLDDYVGKLSPHFKWHDTGHVVEFPLLSSTAHLLNVTSQQWLTTKEAVGPNGAIWTHQVAVVIPKKLTSRGLATAVMTGGCNEGGPDGPKPVPHDEEYLQLGATIADKTGVIVIVIYQIPNCHIVYPSDPTQKRRSEDAMIAWAWRQYIDDPHHRAEWLPRLPMVKAGFACMKAVEEYVATRPAPLLAALEAARRSPHAAGNSAVAATADAAREAGMVELSKAPSELAGAVTRPSPAADGFNITGWVVGGASKRGWTTWMVGAVDPAACSWCPKVVGLTPLVPIVPFLNHSVHMQRRSLGGFTFAFRDYLEAGVLHHMDTDVFAGAMAVVDPGHYRTRLAALPKLAVVSSDDEFMQLDWTGAFVTPNGTETGWTRLPGETHLSIIPNSEHSLATGIIVVVETVTSFVASLDAGDGAARRPSFTYTRNAADGALTVTVPAGGMQPSRVVLRHAQTLSKRRDFRWVRLANASAGDPCKLPGYPVGPVEGGGNCFQPMFFIGQDLHPTRDASDNSTRYVGVPKEPWAGHYTGYYIELFYPSRQLHKTDFQLSTAGFVWPDTFPFADCSLTPEGKCPPHLI
jgi:PhoPQ-activated pathogenicity-related protein